MLFSELYNIMVKNVNFLGFKGGSHQSPPLDPPLSSTVVNDFSVVLFLKYMSLVGKIIVCLMRIYV